MDLVHILMDPGPRRGSIDQGPCFVLSVKEGGPGPPGPPLGLVLAKNKNEETESTGNCWTLCYIFV